MFLLASEKRENLGGYKMYEYKFIQIEVGMLSGKAKENYEDIIQKNALEGWRLHTFSPLPCSAWGQALSIQLIFERESK